MKVKVSEATGQTLDGLVAKCAFFSEGMVLIALRQEPEWVIDWYDSRYDDGRQTTALPRYTTDWLQGGPIIEEAGIHLEWSESHEQWLAYSWDRFSNQDYKCEVGETALIAAMRCFVTSKLGDEFEIPEELV